MDLSKETACILTSVGKVGNIYFSNAPTMTLRSDNLFSISFFFFLSIKAAFFLWLVVKKKLGTQDRLHNPQPGILCLFCGIQIETHEHLLFDCTFSKVVWRKIQQKGNFHVPNLSWEDLVTWMSTRWKGRSLGTKIKKLCLAVVVYLLWWERNQRFHNNTTSRHEDLAATAIEHIRLKLSTYKQIEDNESNRRCQQRWNVPVDIFSP